jgi:hypothetical protein
VAIPAPARSAYVIKVALTRSDMVLQRSKNRFERTMVGPGADQFSGKDSMYSGERKGNRS